MSDSDDAVMAWRNHIQGKIDAKPVDDDGSNFILEDLFSQAEWRLFTDNLRLATSVTSAFKKRIVGFPEAHQPVFLHVQWTGNINVHGRTVKFRRVNGNHHMENE